MTVFQILGYGNVPAGVKVGDMAIFSSKKLAERQVEYLITLNDGEREDFKIRPIIVSLPLTYPGDSDES